MKNRILKTPQELQEFAHHFQARGNPVSLAYLGKARLRGFFDSRGELFAGYACNLTRPLRYREWVPEDQRSHLAVCDSSRKVAELTCIWISRRPTKFTSELIYLRAMLDGLATGAHYILGGTLSAFVYGIQSQAMPHLLYDGETRYFGASRRCWIYYATRWNLVKKLLVGFPLEIAGGLLGKSYYLRRARRKAREIEGRPLDRAGKRRDIQGGA